MSQPPAPSLDESRWIKTAGSLVGVIGAAVGLVYATGGMVLGLRLFIQHFSFGAVIGQLPRQFLLSFGVSEVVLPSAVVAGLYAALLLVRGEAVGPRLAIRWAEAPARRDKAVLLTAALALSLVLVLPAIVMTSAWYDWKRLVVLCASFPLAFILSLVFLELRARLRGDLSTRFQQSTRNGLMVLI